MRRVPLTNSRPMLRLPLAALIGLWAVVVNAAPGVPLEEAPPTGAEGASYFYQQAKEYEIKTVDDAVPLELGASPLLNWSNPARTNEKGIIVIWLRKGRPEALATLFTYEFGNRVYEKHELLSLSEQPLVATFRDRRAWAPSKAGLQFAPLDEVEPPAGQPRLRSLQMRRIAREFNGTITNQERESTTLRQLPQPLYRYEGTTGAVVDGAIFSLNVATDPEALIVIEARKQGEGLQWKYALARLHYNELKIERRDKPVWSAEAIPEFMNDLTGQPKYMQSPYFTYYPQTLLLSGAPAP